MKKKNLKSLKFQKYSVSNLALLHRKVGGILVNETEFQTQSPLTLYSVFECFILTEIVCNYETEDGSPCHTNAGTTRAQPPSEHQGCTNDNALA